MTEQSAPQHRPDVHRRPPRNGGRGTDAPTAPTGGRPHATGRGPVPAARSGRSRIRHWAFWSATVVVLGELLAGAAWNLLTIDWVEAQMDHLGYPRYFAHVLGVCHVGAAVALAVPGFRLVKEWAYAGVFLMWSGAVVSHLARGDGPVSWGPPLMFLAFAVASWALRPAGRRLPETRLRPDRSDDAGRDGTDRPEARPREWAGSIGLLAVLAAVSLATLPVAEDVTREWPAERGWVGGERP
ncbi:DoxX family protein [Streptomyces sp. NPDC035033]|uniref:DoxX family protein n=1 Tax=Streptomyces sp. NPDC035033 TaxID=3155368 RepID=UPI0033E39631